MQKEDVDEDGKEKDTSEEDEDLALLSRKL